MTLSADTIQQLQRLYATQDTYQPNPTVRASIANKRIVAVVGATCMGKNTLMKAATQLDPALSIIGTITSRPPRDSDDPDLYTYIPGTDEGIANAIAQISQGEWVQYAVNPYANTLYGSRPQDYTTDCSMGDFFSEAVQGARTIGFKQVLAATIVCNPELWLQRVNERFPIGHPQRQARRDEAIASLKWSLAQVNDHAWVINNGTPVLGGQALANIATASDMTHTVKGQQLAQACLAAIQHNARIAPE